MPPVAALLAGLLHAATALALFWVSPLNRQDLADNAVEVTFEEPKPDAKPTEQAAQQPAPPPPAPAPAPAPAPPPPPPPAAAEAKPPVPPPAPPKPEPKAEAKSNEPLGVSPPPPEARKPDEPKPPQEAKLEPQKPTDPKPQPAQEAKAEPAKPAEPPPPPKQESAAAVAPEPQPPPPEKPLEKIVPPVEAPPAPLTMRDFVKVLPPPAAPHPESPTHPQPAPQPQQRQALQHSPLLNAPRPEPQGPSGASVSTFVNPADAGSQTRAKDAYLWQVIRKFSQYLPDLRDKNEGGTVILRFVIARDGRLLEASIAKSSGVVALDKGLLDSLRAASPYPPLPPEIPGSQVVFVQPIGAARR